MNPEGFTSFDATADQDEYVPIAFDPLGDKKITETGELANGRKYRIRTFTLPERGDKLYMLATECAKELNLRDSYLLFNKNRSLYKLITTQQEKEHLIELGVIPYSFRSRQIAVVTAKSMFRQFGFRVVVGGKAGQDDYWESPAEDIVRIADPPKPESFPPVGHTNADMINGTALVDSSDPNGLAAGDDGFLGLHYSGMGPGGRQFVSTRNMSEADRELYLLEAQALVVQYNKQLAHQRQSRNQGWTEFFTDRRVRLAKLLSDPRQVLEASLGEDMIGGDDVESNLVATEFGTFDRRLLVNLPRHNTGELEGPPLPVIAMPEPPARTAASRRLAPGLVSGMPGSGVAGADTGVPGSGIVGSGIPGHPATHRMSSVVSGPGQPPHGMAYGQMMAPGSQNPAQAQVQAQVQAQAQAQARARAFAQQQAQHQAQLQQQRMQNQMYRPVQGQSRPGGPGIAVNGQAGPGQGQPEGLGQGNMSWRGQPAAWNGYQGF